MSFLVGNFSVLGFKIQNWMAIVVGMVVVLLGYFWNVDRIIRSGQYQHTMPDNPWAGIADPMVNQLFFGIARAGEAAKKINNSRYGKALCAAVGIAVILVAAIAIDRVWYWYQGPAPKITMARFIDAQADIVSCQSLGLHADGKPDGIVEFSYEPPPPSPLTYIGVPAGSRELYIRLERLNPVGAYDTGSALYILAIAERPGGQPLNEPDGRYRKRDAHHLYAHFCWDGHDKPDSVYRFSVEGAAVPLSKN